MTAPTWRWDPLRDSWVVQAPVRGERRDGDDRDDGDCPFCPGAEQATPPELDRGGDGPTGWSTRVFANLYPILGDGEPEEPRPGAPATGAHEVIVTTPRHDATLADLTDAEITTALEVVARRLSHHLGAGHAYATAFVNEGRHAGATVAHPHGQIMSLGMAPESVEREAVSLGPDTCLLCELPTAHPELVVHRTEDVLAMVPPWSSTPGEMLLAPRHHDAGISSLARLGPTLRDAVACIVRSHHDPDRNVVFHPPPLGMPMHLHAHILPRTTVPGGFELATRIDTTPVTAGEDAERLRECWAQAPWE